MKVEWIDADRYENGGCWAICHNNGVLVSEMAQKGDNRPAFNLACKMAAAPELLEACERMGEYLKQHGGPETQGIACDIFQAISKAKGE